MDGYLFGYSLPLSSDVSECKLLRQYKIGPKKSSKKDGDEAEIGGTPISSSQKNSVCLTFLRYGFLLWQRRSLWLDRFCILYYFVFVWVAPWRSGSVLGP